MQMADAREILAKYLSPSRPVSSPEMLQGRRQELADIRDALEMRSGAPLIFGNRGVGKTSLARTAAQEHSASDRDPVYVACSPKGSLLRLLRGAAAGLSDLSIKLKSVPKRTFEVEAQVGLTPSLKFVAKNAKTEAPEFEDISEAVRVLKGFDDILPSPEKTVVVLDELEEMERGSQADLAYFLKQLGDQEFRTRFILVGIADNIHALIGAHESVPRYIRNVELGTLPAQALMDVVSNPAEKVAISVPRDILMRIAVIGNGYPHFAHLMGLSLLQEALEQGETSVTKDVYEKGLQRAVRGSIEQLKASYDAATQRGTDECRNVVWTLADMELVDVRTDMLQVHLPELAARLRWPAGHIDVTAVLSKLRTKEFGRIIVHTPKRYGATRGDERRYRYNRFDSSLMRGYVRLRAEATGVQLGAPERF